MIGIREYTQADFETIKSWWEGVKMYGFSESFIPEESTYIALWRGEPIASISLVKTNVKEYAWLENLIGNPEMDGGEREYAVSSLVKYVESKAKSLGYEKLLCIAPNGKLSNRYLEMGYVPSLSSVTIQVKELN